MRPRFDGLVRHAGQLYIEQRLARGVREDSRLFVEALKIATPQLELPRRFVIAHVVGEMEDALWASTEATRAEALGYALGELVELLLDIRNGRSAGRPG